MCMNLKLPMAIPANFLCIKTFWIFFPTCNQEDSPMSRCLGTIGGSVRQQVYMGQKLRQSELETNSVWAGAEPSEVAVHQGRNTD